MLPLLLALQVAATPHDALRYDITLVPADTGAHLLGETETTWRLATADPVAVELDSSMRVVRVLIDGRPNTRLSRTMYGRSEHDVLVPHQKQAGDSITTRIRYHGRAHGGARVGSNLKGERIFIATARGDSAQSWLPVPLETGFDRTAASFRIQSSLTQRVIAPGALEKVDTLPYGHAIWRYRIETSAPIASLAVASGPYQVRSLTPGRCGDGCPAVEVWSYPGGPVVPAGLGKAWEMVEFFAERVGHYPYHRLAHVEAAMPATIDSPGMVLHPTGWLAGAGPADSAVAQATARQWFGVGISPAARDDGPLIDGLARLLAEVWRGRAAKPRVLMPRDSLSAAGRAVVELSSLRVQVGDSGFFAGLRAFAAERMHQSATGADFVRAMSAATGRDIAQDLRQTLGRDR
jgi:aminopeptidase N